METSSARSAKEAPPGDRSGRAGRKRLEHRALVERARLLMVGLAAGDSLGSTSELKHRSDMPFLFEEYGDSDWPYRQAGGGPFNLEPGDPTDETESAMCIYRSFLELGSFHPEEIIHRLIRWKRGHPTGIKADMVSALSWAACSDRWWEGSLHEYRRSPNRYGNTALARNGVVAGMARTLEEGFRYSLHQCLLTCFAPVPVICCCAQTYLIMDMLAGGVPGEDWRRDFDLLLRLWLDSDRDGVLEIWRQEIGGELDSVLSRFMNTRVEPDGWNPLEHDWGASYDNVMLTFRIAMWALRWSLRSDGRMECRTAISGRAFRRSGPWTLGWVALLGHHSDTYGAATGPLIAAAHGGVPEGMTSGLSVLRRL